jgi:hypothetical protein
MAALVACAAYIAAYVQDVTLFYYYPMVGEWHWLPQDNALGPRITYFGWKAIGLIAGLVCLLLPARWAAWVSPRVLGWGALLMVGTVCFHESHWFLK